VTIKKTKRTPYKDQVYLDDRSWKEAGTAAGKMMCFGIVSIICVLGAGLYADGGNGPTDHERRQLADLSDQVTGRESDSFGMSYEAKEDLKLPLAVELKPLPAKRFTVPRTLMMALAEVESGNNPNARSKAGAVGRCQIMDATARLHGMNRHDDRQNCVIGEKEMNRLLREFDGDMAAALGAYNCGLTCMREHLDGKRTLPAETVAYIPKVMLAEVRIKSKLGKGTQYARR
jgi:soluble lytic murein transglycosylase-like protein